MKVELTNIRKRFKHEWILWQLSLSLEPGSSWAITGPNGSGKSTLMRILSGHLSPSSGTRSFYKEEQAVPIADVYRSVTYAAPYIDLIEEFTLQEAIRFHQKLKPFQTGINQGEIVELLQFDRHLKKEIRYFSSGMKQRLKLALACCSNSPLLLLDEPTSNLDQEGVAWYHKLLDQFSQGKTVVIASNVEDDLRSCENRLSVMDFKRKRRQ